MSNNARSLNLIGPMFVGSLPGTVIVARRGGRRGASDQLVTGRPEMGSPAPLRPAISVHLPILKFLATVPLLEVSHSTCDRARDRRHALHQAYPVRPGLRQRHSVLVRVLVLPRSHVGSASHAGTGERPAGTWGAAANWHPQSWELNLVVRHVIIFGHGHGLQRAIIDESQHRAPERLIMAQH